MYARLKFRILLSCLGLSKVCSTFDQMANLHSDTLRDLAPFLCMERFNRIPMGIFRLVARNENQKTNGPVNAHLRPIIVVTFSPCKSLSFQN